MVSTKCRLSVSWAHWMLFPWRGRSSSVGWVDHVPFYAVLGHPSSKITTWSERPPDSWDSHALLHEDHILLLKTTVCRAMQSFVSWNHFSMSSAYMNQGGCLQCFHWITLTLSFLADQIRTTSSFVPVPTNDLFNVCFFPLYSPPEWRH